MNYFQKPSSPINTYSFFVGANPPTFFNPYSSFPTIDRTAFLSPFSFIVGDVTIGTDTFIGPFVSIRADEGTPFYIGNRSNLQDGVIIHGLKDEQFKVKGKKYSVYIGDRVSCAHGSLIHGPAVIEDQVFVGFNAIVYNAWIGEKAFISSGATVTNGVYIKTNTFVPPNATIDTQKKADSLSAVPKNESNFANEVQRVNAEFPPAYSLYFGNKRCSCGLACS
ncbi:carbonate dehydratase [Siminovitchia sediminis]|uniref:Carbonate dehydratase n=1 Tax=Siminovitchia sediminis TaxID=1274353 RepID=A0ABW4KMG9_9BACI